jgi:hypothetical protein
MCNIQNVNVGQSVPDDSLVSNLAERNVCINSNVMPSTGKTYVCNIQNDEQSSTF